MTPTCRLLTTACAAVALALGGAPPIAADEAPIAIAIHAGAGTIQRDRLTPEQDREIREALEQAVRTGHDLLAAGGSSLDAVTASVQRLEDSPLFNAGRGAVFNAEGRHELDAAIMDGSNLDAGAVAGVHNVRNPILLARRVMTHSAHVLLSGAGAETFAREQGLAFEDDAWFHTDFRWRQLLEARASAAERESAARAQRDQWLSTVGAVALDRAGNLAAATSTGGMTNKRWGRIGDSPIIGAGTYADNRSCAVSATGHGEYFIRATVARDVCARVQFTGATLEEAADTVINGQLRAMGGEGGIIAVDPRGNIAATFNTPGMYRAGIGTGGGLFVGIYADED